MTNEPVEPAAGERLSERVAPETKEMTVPRETLVATPRPLISTTNRQACLVHIYPTGPGMGSRFMLGDTPIEMTYSAYADYGPIKFHIDARNNLGLLLKSRPSAQRRP